MQVSKSQTVVTFSFTAMFCELAQLQDRLNQLRYWQKTKGPVIQIRGTKGIETVHLDQKIIGIEKTRQHIKTMLYQKHTQTRAQQAASAPPANL